MKFKDIESGLNIDLEADFIIKFDKHKFYIHYSGQGYKGVDYILINNEYLYLIEIKNFNQYHSKQDTHPKDLNEIFLQKCDDTLYVIEQFYKYLQNGFWTRNFILKYKWYFTCPKEWKYWIQAYELFKKKQVIMILHVE